MRVAMCVWLVPWLRIVAIFNHCDNNRCRKLIVIIVAIFSVRTLDADLLRVVFDLEKRKIANKTN